MNHDKQRIAIAEACGWKRSPFQMNRHAWSRGSIIVASDAQLPDYLNDLNAMHEAEKVLTVFDWQPHDTQTTLQYAQNLNRLCGYKNIYHATAAQRAEAFLRTIGKWEEA